MHALRKLFQGVPIYSLRADGKEQEMRLWLKSGRWYGRNGQSGQNGRSGWSKQTKRTGQSTRLILISVCLGVLAILIIYQLQMWQNAEAQSLAQPDAQVDTPVQQNADAQSLVQEMTQAETPESAAADTSLSIATSPLSVRLEVPLIMQLPELPTGCEATATAMMLQYAGSPLTKLTVATEMPYSSDPSQGFVGNPFTEDGFTIYPQALMPLVYAQLGSAVDLTGATLADLRDFLQAGRPVCCWIADDWGYVHCVVVTGYEDNSFYLNDPLEGYRTLNASEFEQLWTNNARRALSY
jgi:uncharacterized protein YvpB